MNPQPPNPRSIFGRAIEIESIAERQAYLDESCEGSPEVRERVEQLLQAYEAAGAFLQPSSDGSDETASYNTSLPSHDKIGPYKLLEKIGEGGMGEVWVADQQEPIKRRVALKLIKPGMDSRGVLARFEAERQALAVMDHPNIARVLDAGTTTDGRPYFVMELVKGTPITEFCDIRKLSPRERLELFVPVCQAIQHAHMKGIIHRDIKPSNVLVALHDERPVPKVIDFGVAKAIGQQLTEKTLYTGFGALVGTPAYMAPEQATFNQLDIDTRADVYALGVLLYELLAGSTPVEPDRLKRAALEEVLRIVRDEEPVRPSQRLSTSQAKATIASTRQSDPTKLAQLMRGELDWIVMKALEKDRSRRYETANGFAADIQRYLAGEQVQAVPPSLGYRLRKVYRRNRPTLLIAGAFASLLLIGLAATTYGFYRAEKAKNRANTAEQAAIQSSLQAMDSAKAERWAKEVALQEAEKTRAEQDRTRRLLYVNQITLANNALNERNAVRVAELLGETVPKAGESDLRGWEWHYLNRQIRADREFSLGDPGEPGEIGKRPEFDPEAVQAGEARRTQFPINTTSRDGTQLLTAYSLDKGYFYVVWDSQTGRRLGRIPSSGVLNPEGHLSVAVSLDGKYAVLLTALPIESDQASADRRGQCKARLWEIASGRELPSPKEMLKGVFREYDIVVGPEAAWIKWVETPDSQNPVALTGPVEVKVARWDRSTDRITRSDPIKLGTGQGRVRFARNGDSLTWRTTQRLRNGMTEPQVESWDISVDPPRRRYDPILLGSVGSFSIAGLSADSEIFAVQKGNNIVAYRLTDGAELMQTPVPDGFNTMPNGKSLMVSQDGRRLVFSLRTRLIIADRNEKGEVDRREIDFPEPPGALHLLPDNHTVVGFHHSTYEVRQWDINRHRNAIVKQESRPNPFLIPRGFAPKVAGEAPPQMQVVAISPDGRFSVEREMAGRGSALRIDGQLRVLHVKGDLIGEIPAQKGYLSTAQFIAKSRRLLITHLRIREEKELPPSMWSLHDPEAKLAVVAKGEGRILLLSETVLFERFPAALNTPITSILLKEILTGKVISRIEPRDNGANMLGVDPSNGRCFVSYSSGLDNQDAANNSCSLSCYETATGKELWNRQIGQDKASFSSLHFTPDGKRLLLGYRNRNGVRLWIATTEGIPLHDLRVGEVARPNFRNLDLPARTANSLEIHSFSASQQFVALENNGEIHVWNLETGKQHVRVPAQQLAGLAGPLLSPDGSRLFTRDAVSPTGRMAAPTPTRLRVWDVATGRELAAIPLSETDTYSRQSIPPTFRNVIQQVNSSNREEGLRLENGKLTVPMIWDATKRLPGYRVLDGSPFGKP